MSDSSKHILRAFGIAATLAFLAAAGYWLLFTHFMVYDDEGYVLWSLRSYFEEGGLYTRVYSQYGPLFYAAYDALHRGFGLEFTNTTARWITLGYWLGTAWSCGAIARRLNGSFGAQLAAMLLTFAALSPMSSEPIHPGGPLAFLSALGAWWGCRALLGDRPRAFVVTTALVGAAMLLIKINVGVFFLIAAGSWLVLHTRGVSARGSELLVLLGSVASPVLLMGDRVATPGYAQFALVFATGAAALALALRRGPRAMPHSPRDWAVLAGLVAVAIALVSAVVASRGTSSSDLVRGVAIAPLNQPLAYSFPPRWQPMASALALASLAAAAWTLTRREWTPALRLTLALLRLGVLGGIAWWGQRSIEHMVGAYLFHFGTSVAWLFAVPLRDAGSRAATARLWLAWVFVWQTLHAFPVAGSQVAWGSLLGAPLLVLGTWEAVTELAGAKRALAWFLRAAACGIVFAPAGILARTGWEYWRMSAALGLPGAERLRVPSNIALALRTMTRNAARHGGTLFSHPGMFSFNLWSGRPTPTPANVTLWSTLLTDAQQEEIRARLAADPRAVIIGQEYVLNHVILQGFAPRGALNRHLVENFLPAFRIDTYVFWVQRGRAIAPVGTARLERSPAPGPWTVELVTDAAGAPHHWQLWTNGVPQRLATGEFGRADAELTPLHETGVAQGATIPLEAGGLSGGLVRLTWKIPAAPLPGPDDLELRVLDAQGRLLEQVPFRR